MVVSWLNISLHRSGAIADTACAVLKHWSLETQKRAMNDQLPYHDNYPSIFTFLKGQFKTYATSNLTLLTFCGISRGLPEPNPKNSKLFEQGQVSHKERLLKEKITQPELLNEFRTFVRNKLKNVLTGGQKLNKPDTIPFKAKIQLSGCLEKGRTGGGIFGHYKDKIQKQFGGALPYTYVKSDEEHPEILREINGAEAYQDLIRIAALEEFNEILDLEEIPGQVELVPEFGYKVRVVTKSPACLIILGTPMGDQVLSLLSRLPATQATLSEDSATKVIHRIKKRLSHITRTWVYSADLSAATDQIPHDAAIAAVEAMADVLHWSDAEKTIAFACIAPRKLNYPDGTTITTKSGILMGLPLVWPILSLLNMFCAEYLSDRNSKGTYVVCGDDLLGFWTIEQISNYQANLASFQLPRNTSKEGLSRDLGVFCEEYYQIGFSNLPQPSLKVGFHGPEYVEVPTGIRLLHRPRIATLLQPKSFSGLSKQLTELSALQGAITSLWPELDRSQRSLVPNLCWKLHPGTLAKAKRLKLSFGAPRLLGGLGLPFGTVSASARRLCLETFVTKRVEPSSRMISLWQTASNPSHLTNLAKDATLLTENLANEHGTQAQNGVPISLASQLILSSSLARGSLDLSKDKKPIPLFTVLKQIRDAANSLQKKATSLPNVRVQDKEGNFRNLALPKASTVRKLSVLDKDLTFVDGDALSDLLDKLRLPSISMVSGRTLPPKVKRKFSGRAGLSIVTKRQLVGVE
jgi:hypothetical protein